MKKKIVFYIGSLAKGGAERVIVNLAEEMQKRGHEVLIVTTVKLEEEYPVPPGVKRIVTYENLQEVGKNRIKNFIRRCFIQRRIWKQEKPSAIVSFIGKNNAMAILTAWRLGIPVLISVRGEPGEEYGNPALRFCAKYLFPQAAGVILQTEDSKNFFSARVREKAVVLPNPLHPAFVEGEPARLHTNLGNEVPKRIIMVGRIDANKNQKLVVDAFISLAKEFPQYVLEIWGKGELQEELCGYVKQRGLSERIFFPGTTTAVKEKLQESSLYILSSNTEGMPNALMEAMAMGLPVISTDCPCGGPRTLIRHGENGWLVPVGDEEAMRLGMETLMENQQLALQLGKNALTIRETLHPQTVHEQWERYILSKCR